MSNEPARSAEELLWNLLGVVELTYHPTLAVAFLLAIEAAVSPVPVVTLDPVSVAVTGKGVPVTTLLAGVAVVDLATDAVGVYTTEWVTTGRTG
jgi:hypothetical protein